jgi:hypothetical protein
MDLQSLSSVFGPWPAVSLLIAYVFYRNLQGQITDLRQRNESLEAEAKETIRAKDRELEELKLRARDGGHR